MLIEQHLFIPLPPPFSNQHSAFCFCECDFFRYLVYVESCSICLCLAYFTQPHVLQVHPCCHIMAGFPSFLRASNPALYAYTMSTLGLVCQAPQRNLLRFWLLLHLVYRSIWRGYNKIGLSNTLMWYIYLCSTSQFASVIFIVFYVEASHIICTFIPGYFISYVLTDAIFE